MKPPRPLRQRLLQLAASGMVPLVIVASCAIAWLVHDRHLQAQRSALEFSRALAGAVDAELRATMAVLQTLSEASELRAGDLPAFHSLARRIAQQRGWRSVVLADGDGKVLLSSSYPLSAPTAPPVDPESVQQLLSTRAPVVGRLAQGPRNAGPAFAVRVPVMREDRLAMMVSAVVPADSILALVQRQKLPPTWVVAVLDQNGERVARSQDNPSRRPSPSLQALLASGAAEGAAETHTLEGVSSFTGFVRLPGSRWTVATGIARSEVDTGLLYPLIPVVIAGVLACFLITAALARRASRRVSEPIAWLEGAAAAVGAGQQVKAEPLGIAELDGLAAALARAAHERTQAQRERDALLSRVTESLNSAQEAARTKDEFLAVLGHELRNPLAPISNALYLMDRKGDESTQTERAIIKRQLGHMTRLVDDLLDVSRITGKRLAMQMKPMQPGVLVQQAAQAVQPLLQGRRLAVDVAPAAAQAWISGDEVRLAQVLNNLLGNAVKFTAADGVIELMLRPADGAVEIEVRDDGQGMSAQVREHAFDLFFQAPQETDRARGGLGLGLAIVKSLVEMHGGSVRAASEGLGHGCSIVVRLPLTQPPAAATAAAPASTAGGGGKVLLVDDNQDAADTAAALLEACGWEVRVAYEPLRALDVLSQFEPGAALLDIGLPGMSGYELARRMRDSGYRGRLIAMTGYGRDADVAAALNASFDDHLTKPVPLDALLAALRDTPAPGAVNPPGN